MAMINGGKVPIGTKAKSVLGTTYKSVPDEPEEQSIEWVPTPQVPEGTLTANVNVSMGARIGLPEYSDARCGASLTLPVAAKLDEIEYAFQFAKKWCEDHVQAMISEIQEDNE